MNHIPGERTFLDTNIFIYDVDRGAPEFKRRIAFDVIRAALAQPGYVISYQIAQEFLNVVTGKFAGFITCEHALDYLESVLRPLMLVHSSAHLFRAALEIRERYRISWYDSLIVAAASEAKCSVLYTEDLQHGMQFGGVRVINPFLQSF